MSRNVIVGLAVLVVAVLAFIIVGRLGDAETAADAPVDAPLTTDESTADEEVVVVEPDADADVEANTAEIVDDTAADTTAPAATETDTTAPVASDTDTATTDTAPAAAGGAEVTTTEVPVETVPAETTAEQADIATLLTPEGYDPDQVLAYVEGSDLDPAVKATLRSSIEQTRSEPALIPTVLGALRTRLGLE